MGEEENWRLKKGAVGEKRSRREGERNSKRWRNREKNKSNFGGREEMVGGGRRLWSKKMELLTEEVGKQRGTGGRRMSGRGCGWMRKWHSGDEVVAKKRMQGIRKGNKNRCSRGKLLTHLRNKEENSTLCFLTSLNKISSKSWTDTWLFLLHSCKCQWQESHETVQGALRNIIYRSPRKWSTAEC